MGRVFSRDGNYQVVTFGSGLYAMSVQHYERKLEGLMEYQKASDSVEVSGRRSEIGCKRKRTGPGD